MSTNQHLAIFSGTLHIFFLFSVLGHPFFVNIAIFLAYSLLLQISGKQERCQHRSYGTNSPILYYQGLMSRVNIFNSSGIFQKTSLFSSRFLPCNFVIGLKNPNTAARQQPNASQCATGVIRRQNPSASPQCYQHFVELLKIFGKPWGVLDFLVRFVSRQNERNKNHYRPLCGLVNKLITTVFDMASNLSI